MTPKKDRFFQMRVDQEFLQRLDDVRREEPDLPSRTQMARRLIDLACAATELKALMKSGSIEKSKMAFADVMERLSRSDPLALIEAIQNHLAAEDGKTLDDFLRSQERQLTGRARPRAATRTRKLP